jgi:putative ABC transport system ATP-binding protein
VLADEPTGNLDARAAQQILLLLREQLRANGASAILITHSISAARSADRQLQLVAGQLRPAPPAAAAPDMP